MAGSFSVGTTKKFDRLARAFAAKHPAFPDFYDKALAIFRTDPHNRRREHDIKKLTDVPHGEGALGLRLGDWRFFFDVYGSVVVLGACDLRDDHTYRR
jgi:hypothetical protein